MQHLFSVAEAATQCGVSVGTMRKWLRERRIAFFKLGTRVLIDQADLNNFILAGRVAAHVGNGVIAVAAEQETLGPDAAGKVG